MMLFLKKLSAIFIVCAVILTNAFVVSAEAITFVPSDTFNIAEGNAYIVATSDKYLFASNGDIADRNCTISVYDKNTAEVLTSVQSYSGSLLKVYAMHVKGDYLYVSYVQREGNGNPRVCKYNIKEIYEGKTLEPEVSKGQSISNYSYINDDIFCRFDYSYQNVAFMNTESLSTRASIGISDENMSLFKSYTTLCVADNALYTVYKKNIYIYDALYALSGASKQDNEVYKGYFTPGISNITKIAGNDGYLYAGTDEGIYVYDMKNLSSPEKTVLIDSAENTQDIKFNNGYMYVAAGKNILVYSILNPEMPALVYTYETDAYVYSLNLRPDKIYAAQTGKVSAFDVSGIEIEESVVPGSADENVSLNYKTTLEENASEIASDDEYLAVVDSSKTVVCIYKKDTLEKTGEIFKDVNGEKLTINNISVKRGELFVSYDSVLRKYSLNELEENKEAKERAIVPLFSDLAKDGANIIEINDKYIFVAAVGIKTGEVALANSKILIFDRNTLEYITSIRRASGNSDYDLPVRNMYASGDKLFVSWNNAKTSVSYQNAITGSSLYAPVYVYNVGNLEKGATVSGTRITSNNDLSSLSHPYNRGGNSFLDEENNMLYLGVYTKAGTQNYVSYDVSGSSPVKKFTLSGGSMDCTEFFVHNGCFYEVLQNNGGLSKTGTTTQEYNKILRYDISAQESVDLAQNLKATYQTKNYGESIISDVAFDSGMAYIAAKVSGGVEIADINTLNPVSFLSTGKSVFNVKITDGLIFVAASTDIYIYSADNHELLGKYELGYLPYDMEIDANEKKIYVASLRENCYGDVLSYSDAGNVEYVNSLLLEDITSFGAHFGDTFTFVGEGSSAEKIDNLWVYNTTTKEKISQISELSGAMSKISSNGNLFYTYEGKALTVYGVFSSDKTLADCVKCTYEAESDITAVCFVGNSLYMGTKNGIIILDVSQATQGSITYLNSILIGEEITALNVKDGYIYGACALGELFIYDTENSKKIASAVSEDVLINQIEISGTNVFFKTDSGSVLQYETTGDITVTYDVDIKTPEDKEIYSLKYERGFPYVDFEKRVHSTHSLIAADNGLVATAGKGNIKLFDADLNELCEIPAGAVSSLYLHNKNLIALKEKDVVLYDLTDLSDVKESVVVSLSESGILYADEDLIWVWDSGLSAVCAYSLDGSIISKLTDVPAGITEVYFKDKYLYLASDAKGYVYDVSELYTVSEMSAENCLKDEFTAPQVITAFEATEDNYLYVSTYGGSYTSNKLCVYSIGEAGATYCTAYESVTRHTRGGRITDMLRRGDYLIADCVDAEEIQVINIQSRTTLYRESAIRKAKEDNYSFSDIAESDGRIYAISQNGGICVYKFTAIDIADICFVSDGVETYVPKGDKVSAKLSIYNESGEDIEGKLILAVYEGAGAKSLSNITITDVSAPNGMGTDIVTEELSVDATENVTIKAMIFKDLTSLKPMCESERTFESAEETTIYVDAQAEYGGDGTAAAPFKTIEEAKEKVKTINKAMTTDITVEISGGRYELSEPIVFNENDSGFNGYSVIYKAKEGETPVISGGRKIEGWSLYDSEKGIYVAPANGIKSRQLVVDGKRAVRARSEGGFIKATWSEDKTGIYCYNEELCNYKNIRDLELVFNNNYKSKRAGIDAVYKIDSDGKVLLMVNSPFNKAVSGSGSYVVPSYYENALELLDEENEFYLDMTNDLVYYKPKSGTDINESEIYASALDELMVFEGRSLYNRAKNIEINGLTFTETTWMLPTENGGFYPTQAGYWSSPENGVFPIMGSPVKQAIKLERAEDITITNCELKNLGATAIGIISSSKDIKITNNIIKDVSAGGIYIGETDDSDANPTDERKCIKDILVSNNHIGNIGCEYYAFCAVTVATAQNVEVSHNEIAYTPYSAIHIGWGWDSLPKRNITGLKVEYNYIHDVIDTLSDAGAIYTTGYTLADYDASPNIISYNYIKNLKQGGTYAGAAIYLDTGSSGYAVCSNVVDLKDCNSSWIPKWSSGREDNVFKDNYSTTSRGYSGAENTVVSVNAQWDEIAAAIIENAGIESK